MSEAANTQGIRLLDSTLRDGSHGIRHRYTPQQVELIAGKLDEAGVHSIGVGHGDGLGASSIQYMRSLHTDDELLTAADSGAAVVAAGCLAERYGSGLAQALPEAQILSFDDYANIADRLDAVHAGDRVTFSVTGTGDTKTITNFEKPQK